MIITRAPFRISFLGGGSDLASFYSQSPGAVLSVTINKYMYISTHRFFEKSQTRVKYSQTETVSHLSELKHPIVREVLNLFQTESGLEISSNADIPAGTGLGSSSAFTIGMLHNFYVRQCSYLPKKDLAEMACDIEINRLKEPIGKQDQYAIAFGGLNIFRFLPMGDVSVEPVHLKVDDYKRFRENLMLFYTGIQRSTSAILSEQKENMQKTDQFRVMKQMVSLVDDGRDALYSGKLDDFGKILHEGWLLKKTIASKITSSEIDDHYESAIKAGALGGKLLGAGGGGFLLFYCEKEYQDKVRAALSGLREFQFQFESEGSKVIYFGDE